METFVMIRSSIRSGRIAALAAIVTLSAAAIQAQATAGPTDSAAAAEAAKFGWKHRVGGMLNLSQAYYDKWAKGGTDNLAYEWNFGGSIDLEQPDYQWETKAKAIYGRTKLGSLASRKSSDQFDFESVYTRLLKIHVNPFASVTAQSQFMPGYAYTEAPITRTQISDYFNPAYFTETAGLGVEPVKDLKERLGATMKQTVGSFGFQENGVRTGRDFRQEYGVSSTTEYERSIMENIHASTRLDVFVNFKGIDNIDGRWANKVTAKVNKLVSANVEYEVLYDSDLSLDTQTREGLSIGISFLSL
ncbi:MAG: hypothetical protein JWO30_3712 [Fibrobacteres bacterium]|nr:hypothetical protein [Fibrobacterota bacterium]